MESIAQTASVDLHARQEIDAPAWLAVALLIPALVTGIWLLVV